ncbi:MAG TPA: ABC transporter substrate-binding protein [Burkholderiales bacterium]|nr:ABC transporter substrate-binding protein [Burkholderiales bacterium]
MNLLRHASLTLLLVLPGLAFAADLRVAIVSRTVFYVPLWLAQDKGYLKDEGIGATVEIFDNAEKIMEDLRSGRSQIAITTPESVVVDAYRGGSLRIIAANAERLPHFIIAKPQIKSLEQLRGARFGVLSLNEGTTYLVHRLAGAIGLKPGEYEVMAVGGAPTRWRLLQEGKIDAGLQPFPLSYEAEAAGFTNFGPISKYVSDYLFTAVGVDTKWAEQNRPLVQGFLRALRRGQDEMGARPGDATAVAARELRTAPALAERALADTARLKILSPDLSVSDAALRSTFETVLGVGLLPAGSVYERARMVDSSYLGR